MVRVRPSIPPPSLTFSRPRQYGKSSIYTSERVRSVSDADDDDSDYEPSVPEADESADVQSDCTGPRGLGDGVATSNASADGSNDVLWTLASGGSLDASRSTGAIQSMGAASPAWLIWTSGTRKGDRFAKVEATKAISALYEKYPETYPETDAGSECVDEESMTPVNEVGVNDNDDLKPLADAPTSTKRPLPVDDDDGKAEAAVSHKKRKTINLRVEYDDDGEDGAVEKTVTIQFTISGKRPEKTIKTEEIVSSSSPIPIDTVLTTHSQELDSTNVINAKFANTASASPPRITSIDGAPDHDGTPVSTKYCQRCKDLAERLPNVKTEDPDDDTPLTVLREKWGSAGTPDGTPASAIRCQRCADLDARLPSAEAEDPDDDTPLPVLRQKWGLKHVG